MEPLNNKIFMNCNNFQEERRNSYELLSMIYELVETSRFGKGATIVPIVLQGN